VANTNTAVGEGTVFFRTLLHLPPLKFHCDGRSWDRTNPGLLQCLHWQSDALNHLSPFDKQTTTGLLYLFLFSGNHIRKSKLQHCFICRPSSSILTEEAEIDRIQACCNVCIGSQALYNHLSPFDKQNTNGLLFCFFFPGYHIRKSKLQHCFICRPSDSAVTEEAGIDRIQACCNVCIGSQALYNHLSPFDKQNTNGLLFCFFFPGYHIRKSKLQHCFIYRPASSICDGRSWDRSNPGLLAMFALAIRRSNH
jgi:hypothetical protein